MLISHRSHTDNIQVYSVTVMTHVKALQAGHSSQETSEPITPGLDLVWTRFYFGFYNFYGHAKGLDRVYKTRFKPGLDLVHKPGTNVTFI